MKIDQYVASLNAAISKDDIKEDIRMTREELASVVEPTYKTSADFFKNYKFKSSQAQAISRTFRTWAGGPSAENIIVSISKAIPAIASNLTAVEKLIERSYGEDISGEGFSYRKASLLQFIEATSFVTRYARKLLNFILTFESAELPDTDTVVADSLAPADIEYINANLINFAKAFDIVSTKEADLNKALSSIPDLSVSVDDHENVVAVSSESKVDPLRFGFIAPWLNPIYHVRMSIATWQAARYREAKAEVRALELKILNLKKLNERKPDPIVQKRLYEAELAVSEYTAKLDKMERAWNG